MSPRQLVGGDTSTAYLGDEAVNDELEREGVTDIVAAEQDGGSWADLAKKHTAPMKKGAGKLLEQADPTKIYKQIEDTIRRQDRLATNREERAKHYKAIQRGNSFSYLEKSDDRSVYKQAVPPFMEGVDSPPVPNKMADLCKKIINQLLVDDFLPNPKPDGDTDKDRGAGDLTKKFLREDGTQSGTNDKQMLREALAINITSQAAFAQVWVDPTGGGWRPKQIMAHPRALDANKPMLGPKVDPKTQQPVMGPDGMAVMERSSSPILRFVAEVEQPDPMDPTAPPVMRREFTNDPARAARLWMPKLRRTLLQPPQVRTVPASADVFEAQEIILLMAESLGTAKRRFTILDEMTDAQLKTLTDWRPKKWESLVPEALMPKRGQSTTDGPNDDTLIFWYHHYCRIGTKYVDGSEIAVSGALEGILLKRDTLREDVKADDGTLVPVLMDPGVTQFTCLNGSDGDPFGEAAIAEFASGNEAYAQIWMGLLEAMDKAVHLNVMIPSTSSITRAEWNRRDGTPLDVLTANDKPFFEEAPQPPQFIDKMLDAIELHLNSAAGTNETSSGLDSPFSISGKAKEIAIKQARVQLAQYWQNTVNGACHWWKIKTQRAQAYLTVPQQVKLSGEESAYKQPYWTGADIMGISELTLAPGSGTMMASNEKLEWLGMMQERGWIDPETAAEMARASMTDDLGILPNIHEERINRCISEWAKGEPVGWREQYDAFQAYQQQLAEWEEQAGAAMQEMVATGLDEASAQQQVQTQMPAPVEVPAPSTPFTPRPNDGDQTVALIHYKRMNRMSSTSEYEKHEAPWRGVFDEAFTRIAAAAGVKSLAQQAEEAAAAQDAANAAAAQGNADQEGAKAQGDQAKAADKQADREFKAQEGDKAREHELEKQARALAVQETAAATSGASGAGQPVTA